MLIAHILYLGKVDRAELQTLFNSKSGIVGVNMSLYYLVVVNHNNAVAYGFKISAELYGILAVLVSFYYVFGAVGEVNILVEAAHNRSKRFYCDRLCCLFFIVGNNSLALENASHSSHHYAKTLSSGVHNSRLFKGGQKVGGGIKHSFSLGAYLAPEDRNIGDSLTNLPCPYRRKPCNR